MTSSRTLLILPFLAFIALDAEAGERPDHDAWLTSPAPRDQATTSLTASTPKAYVASVEPSRGAPSMLILPANGPRGPGGSAVAVARHHLNALRHYYRAGASAIRGARHRFTHNTGRGSVIVVLRQTVDGIDVFHGDVKVLLDSSRRVRAVSGSPHPAATPASARSFAQRPDEAIALALADLYPESGDDLELRPTGKAKAGWQHFELTADPGFRLLVPARAKKVYYPVGEGLEPAYFLEVQAQRPGVDADVYQYVIAADDGRVLHRRDATDYEAYQYRVWADADGDLRPKDGPMIDYTPHPTGVPGEAPTEFTAPPLVSIDGFNSFKDPWLPEGATETLGNNVDAYIDHKSPQGLSDGEYRASVTAPGIFDRLYDVTAEPLADEVQSMASITQLFYTINWMHNYWYDSGFDEAAGNAQTDNYGRGGIDGDVLLAEAQDAALQGARNNANMSTPADGASPRMQMYLWSGQTEASVTVEPLAETYDVGNAGFGPKDFDVTALLRIIDDGDGNLSDGCQPAVNDLNGRIALIDRGACSFETKATNALNAGAVGVLIANNQGGGAPTLGGDNNLPDPQIPSQGISQADGNAIKAALENDPQTANMLRASSVERDGTIDNMIVAHEWGHYIHNRLVENGSVATRSQGEGWGDFMALHMALRDTDDQLGVYPGTTYASLDKTGYYGIRRVPYSVDTTKNALSFRHISNGEPLPNSHPIQNNGIPNSEVHNAGEVWTTMLWESYIALHTSYEGSKSFDEARRAFADYLVAGMILAPTMPTYTEQRDAILMAIAASNSEDFTTVATAFASRGAGTCAVSPPRMSTDLVGVVEDFELSARGILTGLSVSDSLLSCDDDGIVDDGELGEITIGVLNAGANDLAGATVEVVDPDPSLVFPDGPLVMIPDLGPQIAHEASIPVAIDDALTDYQPITITVRLTSPEGCEKTMELVIPAMIQGDVVPQSSKTDDVEAPLEAWTAGGVDGPEIWYRSAVEGGHLWHGDDVGRVSDTWLESPEIFVSEDEPLVITLGHAYSFEFSDNTYWDGGVIEVSGDAGKSWEDISVYLDPGYPDAINSGANPLDKRPAFVGDNPSYPDMDPLVLDLGMAFAGAEAKLRFRIGTDAAAGGPGWDIDNIAFAGITNSPFATWVADQGICVDDTDTDTDSDSDSVGTDGTDSAGTDGTDSAGTDSAGSTSMDTFGTDGTDSGVTDGTDSGGETTGMTTGSSDSAGTAGSAGPGGSSDTDPDSATGTDSAGQGTVTDDGCGCSAQDDDPPIGLLALGLLVLARRRRR